MPLYEYRCLKCEHVMEVLQKLSDPPLRRCRACSGKVEKMISRTSFQLKGGGWFDQGYGGASSDKASAGGEKAASASAGGSKDGASTGSKEKKTESSEPAK